MVAVILGITTYMFQREMSDRIADNAKLTDENSKLNKTIRTALDQIESLKNLDGVKMELVEDLNNPQNQATVIYSVRSEIGRNGMDLVTPTTTVVEALRKLREALDAASADRDTKALKIASLEKEILALRNQYQVQVDNYAGQAKNEARDKLAVVGDRDEKITAKVNEINKLKSEINITQDELAQEKESREKERKDLNSKISALEIRIDILKDKIDNLEKLSFEVADGVIRRVEHASHTVWINLGEKDFLKPRMTFSVYGKENEGVGRGAEDIKGKIEVTRILGDHMAEARVIEEDLYRPIVSEDLIYTPIWSPGLIERISIIGGIDLDQDGRSDRQQFHEMLANSGCIIDNEVDDNGDRIPPDGKITVQTRFLVKGDIPELISVSGEEKDKILKINAHLSDMQKEARSNGVRVIKLNDFLAYVGYHNKRRTFLPGQNRPFTLKAGSASTGSNVESIDRLSTGNVSAIFDKKRRQMKQDASDGATSKSFGGEK